MKKQALKIAKHALSLVLAFAVMAVSMFTAGVSVFATSEENFDTWDGTLATAFADTAHDGSTADNAIIISSAEELAYLAKGADGNTAGKYYKIADGIKYFDMNGNVGVTENSTAAEVAAASATGNNWGQTVDNGNPFKGSFDGNGVVIYNIRCTNSWSAGLFPCINSSGIDGFKTTFKNFSVKASYFDTKSGAYTFGSGAIFGAHINSANNKGILVEKCAVVNNYVKCGARSDNNRGAGAIAGCVPWDTTYIHNCLVKGNTLVSDTNATVSGGLVCQRGGAVEIKYTVVFDSEVMSANVNQWDYCTGVYTDQATTVSGVTTLTTAEMTGAAATGNMPSLDWDTVWFANAGTPELRVFHTFIMTDNGDGTHTESCDDCGLAGAAEPHADADTDYICDVCGAELPLPDTSVIYWDGSTYTEPTDDDGDGVYIIDTAAKLAYLASKTKDNTYETYGKTFKVADGIKAIVLQPESLAAIKDKTNAAEVKAFFDENADAAKWWNVIGYRGEYPFQGTFDGNGATIYGIYANWASYADWHSDLYAGLFGLVDQGAVIKNVAVKNSYLTTKNGFMGAIFANSAMNSATWNVTENMGTGDVVVENCVAANNYMNAPTENYNNRTKFGVLLGAADYDYLKLNNCMAYGNDAKTDIVTPDSEVFDIPFIGALNGDKVDGLGVNSVANVISLGATPYNRYNFGWGSYLHHEGNNTGTNCFKNVYTDQPLGYFTMYNGQSQYHDFDSKAIPNLTSITADGIKGVDAVDAMPELDWANAWFAVRDGMPELRVFHTAFTATDNGDGTHTESCDNGALVGVAQAHTDTDEDYICDVCGAELPRPDTSVIYWDGSTYTEPEYSAEDDVYIIDEASDLAYIACKTQSNHYETYGKTFKVADGIKSIVLQPESLSAIKDKTNAAEVKAFFDENAASAKWWNVIGYKGAYPFQGTFDGNGATIYGIYANWASYADWHSDLYAGLFGLVDKGAVIKNVAVKNSYLTTKGGFMGAIFANTAMDDSGWNATANMGAGDVVVENCVAANNYMNAPTENYNNQKKYGVLTGASGYDYLKMNDCMAYGNDAKTDLVTPDNEVFDIPFIGGLNGDKVDGKGVNSVTNVISLGTTPYNRYAFSWGAYVNHEGDGTNTSCFKNVYTDQPIGNFIMYNGTSEYKNFENSEIYGLVSITADGITGADAVDAMPELDWVNAWFAVRDGMPELRVFHTAFTATDNGDGTHSESCDNGALVGVATAHDWSAADGYCTVCGAECQHGYDVDPENGSLVFEATVPGDCDTPAQGHMKCSICGLTDPEVVEDPAGAPGHDWSNADGICAVCGTECEHNWSNGACTICGVECEHDWSNADGICATCGATCEHGYDVDPENGSLVFEATVPGDCNTPAKGHMKCSICGLTDPEVVEDPEGTLAAHQLTDVAANAPTCTEDGNIAHKKCEVCSKLFDAEGHELTAEDIIDAAPGHQLTDVAANAPTCTENGNIAHKKCEVCGKLFDAEGHELTAEDIIDAAPGHQLTDVAAKDATCTENGNIAYKKCEVCGKMFDAEGHELTAEDIIVAAGHKLTDVAAKDATCTENGNIAHKKCEVCDKMFDAEGNELTAEDIIVAAGHKLTDVAAKDATCTENGNIAHKKCEVCGKLFDAEGNELTAEDIIVAPGHKLTDVAANAPTCTENGNIAHKKCEVCGKLFDAEGNELTAEDIIDAAPGHQLTDVAANAPTCTENGNIAHKKCEVCGKLFDAEGHELTAEDIIVAAGHKLTDVAAKDATCTENGNIAHKKCEVCGKLFDAEGNELTAEDIIVAAGHKLTDVAAKDATCTENGNIAHKKCEVCGKLFDAEGKELTLEAVTISAPGHDWSNADGICAVCGAECEHDWADGECLICGKKQYAPGDVNGDGKVNNKDLGLLMQHLNSWEVEITGDEGDVTGDGKVNNKDYGLLMQFVNNWDVKLV